MPGSAKSSSFLLSSATVMIGNMADLHLLNPAEHSIGLVKNFVLSSDPRYVELVHGLPEQVYMSLKATDGLHCSMEVFEYTARNLAYAAGFVATDSSYTLPSTIYQTTTSTVPGATGIIVDGDATFLVDKWLYLQNPTDRDIVHIAQVVAADYDGTDTTLTFTDFPTPVGVTFPIGSKVGQSKDIEVNRDLQVNQFVCAKVVGMFPQNNRPFVILFPKIRITKALQIQFSTTEFANLPFEFTPYSPIDSDPLYGTYGKAAAILFPSGTPDISGTDVGDHRENCCINFMGDWNSFEHYIKDDAVFFGNSTYICLVANTNVQPDSDGTKWHIIAAGASASDVILDETHGIVGDGVTDDGPAINVALQLIKNEFGRGVARFAHHLRCYTSISLVLPDRVGLVGSAYSMANINGLDGAQLIYGGADAGVVCESGELDLRKSQGVFVHHLGIEVTQAGAIGFRGFRTDGLALYNVGVRLTANNQWGFHFKAERSGGAFEGNYDLSGLFLQVINTNGSTGCTHINMTAEDDHGQNNTCWFGKCSTRGRGTHWKVAASETLTIDTPRCEGFDVLALDVVGKTADLDVRSMYMEPHADWAGHSEAGTDKVISFLNGGTLSRRAHIWQPGFNGSSITGFDCDLADTTIMMVGNVNYVGAVNTANYVRMRVIGESFDRYQRRSAGQLALGPGTVDPVVFLATSGPTTPTTLYTQTSNLNHDLRLGQDVHWKINGAMLNGLFNSPTNGFGSQFYSMEIENIYTADVLFHAGTGFDVDPADFIPNYRLAPGARIAVLFKKNDLSGQWRQVSSVKQIGGSNFSMIGALPTVTGLSCKLKSGFAGDQFKLSFTLANVSVPVTDGGASGSYGSVEIFDFIEGALGFVFSRMNFTAFVEGAALTSGAGDAVHVLGVGTTPITTARNGTLTGNEQNVCNVSSQITDSGGTGLLGTKLTSTPLTVDGSVTASKLYLNWSGTAASIDANSTIGVSGTITITVIFLDDD